MTENNKNQQATRATYVAPYAEAILMGFEGLLAASFRGKHKEAVEDNGESDHLGGDDGGVEYGTRGKVFDFSYRASSDD